MNERQQIDIAGAAALVGFSALLGINQVVIKLVNEGLQPVFFAGLRSLGAALCLGAFMWIMGRRPQFRRGYARVGILAGVLFAVEFILLFIALDYTTVVRVGVIFYSMPVWLAIASHFVLPAERMSGLKAVGLVFAFLGVAIAITSRGSASGGALLGDLCALGAAMAWASIALLAKASRLRQERPEMQLMWQVTISTPILLLASYLFGPFIREFQPVLHLSGVAFQIALVSIGFVFWFWLLSIYPASGVASFSFLGPVFGVFFGWFLLGEPVGGAIWVALACVALGLVLINRPQRA